MVILCLCSFTALRTLSAEPPINKKRTRTLFHKESGSSTNCMVDRDMLRGTVLQFLPLSNILKISDEELEFLTGTTDIESALPQLLVGDVQLVVYTCGSSGAHAYTRTAHGFAPCRKVRAVDTTGAGDGFIGSFLWQLERDGVTLEKLAKLSKTKLNEYLAFSNQFCGISVQQHGAIDSYPTLDQMQ